MPSVERISTISHVPYIHIWRHFEGQTTPKNRVTGSSHSKTREMSVFKGVTKSDDGGEEGVTTSVKPDLFK